MNLPKLTIASKSLVANTFVIKAKTPYGVKRNTSVTIRITTLYKLSIKFAKNSASFGAFRRTPKKAIPTKAAKITTPIVLVGRVPAKSAKTLVGMKDKICCGIEKF